MSDEFELILELLGTATDNGETVSFDQIATHLLPMTSEEARASLDFLLDLDVVKQDPDGAYRLPTLDEVRNELENGEGEGEGEGDYDIVPDGEIIVVDATFEITPPWTPETDS